MAEGRAGSAAPFELVSAVAHELKSPLAAIRGAAAALARQENLAEQDRRTLLAVIEDASAQADRLVADLLLAGRVGARRLPVSVEGVDVVAIVSAAAKAAASAHEGVTVRTQIPDGVRPQARADPARLREVIDSLVDNAIVHAQGESEVLVIATQQQERVRIEIVDRGPGVPSRDRERIFEPYVRLSERVAGTGLGLHLARELARAMGGDVTLERADDGASFVVDLPATTD